MDRTLIEEAVAYDGDLVQAASVVLSTLDDQDGLTLGSDDFMSVVEKVAREYGVGKRDLLVRVKELLDDEK